MAGMAVQDKISKINAELARLELEMELDHGGQMVKDNLGMKWSNWFGWFGDGTELTPTEATEDKTKFSNDVLLKVFRHKSISVTPESVVEDTNVVGRFKKFPRAPIGIWAFKHSDKSCLIAFWAAKAATYTVISGEKLGLEFDPDTMPITQVWSDRKKTGKNFAFVQGRLYADILTLCGELKFE